MDERALVFECQGQQLVGVLHIPDSGRCNMGIVVVVGGPQYRVGSHRQFVLMARTFAENGYPVLRFDYRGMGDSDGPMLGFEHIDQDIKAAIDAMVKAAPGIDGVVLWGLCDAASACMMYGNKRDMRVQGMILANPWVRTSAGEASAYLKYYYLQRVFQKTFWHKLFSGTFNFSRSMHELLGMLHQARKTGKEKAAAGHYIDRMLAGLEAFNRPLLLLCSERDLTAREFTDFVANTTPWQARLNNKNDQVIVCPGADHTFSKRSELLAVNARCIQWLHRLQVTSL